jgi:hypothetical protein
VCLRHVSAKVLHYEGVGRGGVTHTQIHVSHIRTCDVRRETEHTLTFTKSNTKWQEGGGGMHRGEDDRRDVQRAVFLLHESCGAPAPTRQTQLHTTDSANCRSGAPQAEHEVWHGAQGDTRANGREGGGRHMASEPKAM